MTEYMKMRKRLRDASLMFEHDLPEQGRDQIQLTIALALVDIAESLAGLLHEAESTNSFIAEMLSPEEAVLNDDPH